MDLKNTKSKIAEYESISKDSFFEIPPLDFEIDNASRKELSSVPI